MSEFEKKRIDKEFADFTKRNFERPKRCKNFDQVRYYVQELCQKIEGFKQRFNYVPNQAYTLLAEYNRVQNKMGYAYFKATYR